MKSDKRQATKILKIVGAAILIAVPLFIAPQTTHAIFGLDISPAGIVTTAFRAIAFLFNYIFGLLYILASLLVQAALNLNGAILNHQNQIVTIGWTILRDVANLGFVLVMIIVAVATIFRYEQFSAKKLLPRLIAAAIIVNFSLTIAGAFIVFSNSLTNVFLENKLGGNVKNFATTVSDAFAPQTFYLPPQNPEPPNPADQGSAFSGFGEAVLTGISGLIFSMVFTLIAALVMLALAMMLIARYVILSVLLLTAPITWLFWVFPPLNDIFHTWWKKFMQWVFFLPAVAFFIYLALTSVQFFSTLGIDSSSIFSGSGLTNVFDQGIKMIILCGLMLGGLIVANNMGIAGAGGAMKLAKGVGDSAKKWAKNTSQRIATVPARTQWGRNLTGKMQTAGQNMKPWQRIALGVGTLGLSEAGLRATRAGGNAIAQQRAKADKQAADAKKKFKDLNLKEKAQRMATANNPERVSLASDILSERKKRKEALDKARGKKQGADKAVDAANDRLKNAEVAVKRGDEGALKEAAEARDALAKAVAQKATMDKSFGEAMNAARDMVDVMNQIPRNMRDKFREAGYDLAKTRLGMRYGKTAKKYSPTSGKTEKVEEAIKAISDEDGGEDKDTAAKPSGDKKK